MHFIVLVFALLQANVIKGKTVTFNENNTFSHQLKTAIANENRLLSPPTTGNSEHIEWQLPLDDKNVPCYTNSTKNEIVCLGPGFTDVHLRKWFAAFSKTQSISPSFMPYGISINLRDLVALESKVFSGILLGTIFIRGNNFTYIDRDAFQGTENSVQSLYIYRTKLTNFAPKYNFFAAIKTLSNLNKLTIASNFLAKIPDRAFANENPLKTNLQELKEIVITNGSILSIGTDAFADLSKLTRLQLTQNQISQIKPFAFRTNYHSNVTLVIDLTENQLEATSFEINALVGSKRPIKIYFGLGGCNSKLKHLPENIFRPFLDQNERNVIDVGRMCFSLVCDCSMAWILEEKYVFRIKNFRCQVNKDSSLFYHEYSSLVLNCPLPADNPTGNSSIVKNQTVQTPNGILTSSNTSILPNSSAPVETASSHHILSAIPNNNGTILSKRPVSPTDSTDYCNTKNCIKHGLEMNNYLNRTVDPCDSFYDFACNGWENNHLLEYLLQVLSNGGSEYDNFVKVRLKIEENLDKLLTVDTDKQAPLAVNGKSTGNLPVAKHHDETPKERHNQLNILPFVNTKHMYGQCLSSGKGANFDALQLILNDIGGWPLISKNFDATRYTWEKHFVIIINKYKDNIFIELDSGINEDSVKHLTIKSGSFVVSKRKLLSVKLNRLENYANYMLNTAMHFGAQNVQNETINEIWEVIRFEKMVANIAKKTMDNMIERKLETIGCLINEINWFQIFFNFQKYHGVNNETTFSQSDALYDVHYLIDLSRLLARTDKRIIANYLGWRVIESFGFLIGGSTFVEIQQNFYSTESRESAKLIKKQCLEPIARSLPYLMARVYLDKHLPLHSRKNARAIVEQVRTMFVQSMSGKSWIDDTREALVKRVENITINIGYPDWILDDRHLINHYNVLNYTRANESTTNDIVRYYNQIQEIRVRHMLTNLGGKVNKSYFWDPLPLYVGASYDIVGNVVSIPMGLLQSPFYEEDRPFYLNFASLGSFFGHELSHSVTPRYSEFERLMAPWSDHFLKEYLSKAQCFVSQYTNYYDKSAEQHLDGMRTFEEDMSDLAGIQAAFNAYKKQTNETADMNLLRLYELPDFSTDMLFFLSFAQKWCRSNSRVQTRLKISKSVHSPEKYRVNGALSNLESFAKAFNCTAGSPMNPIKKCESW